ncbi:hypothetical protein [Streptomyces cyaneofuscatus]|uniref:hypothetical protein n=1 Tax=Streptomyces cyaneofuscatus TaxID=66883 RepID=UPI003667403E
MAALHRPARDGPPAAAAARRRQGLGAAALSAAGEQEAGRQRDGHGGGAAGAGRPPARPPTRDSGLERCAEAFAVVLGPDMDLADGWQAWRLGLTPTRHSRGVMGVPAHSTA